MLWQAMTCSELEQRWGVKGEVMLVSRGQRKGRMEKNLVKRDMQDRHTEGKEPAQV